MDAGYVVKSVAADLRCGPVTSCSPGDYSSSITYTFPSPTGARSPTFPTCPEGTGVHFIVEAFVAQRLNVVTCPPPTSF
jgi:hypothetical protein